MLVVEELALEEDAELEDTELETLEELERLDEDELTLDEGDVGEMVVVVTPLVVEVELEVFKAK